MDYDYEQYWHIAIHHFQGKYCNNLFIAQRFSLNPFSHVTASLKIGFGKMYLLNWDTRNYIYGTFHCFIVYETR